MAVTEALKEHQQRQADQAAQAPPVEAGWFGSTERPIFGTFHPAAQPARDCVVVLCNPFGYDVMITHYAYRHLAERLAKAGIAALRFDYFGTGDSGGDDASPERVEEWLASIHAACAEAKRRSGASSVALFGLRVGGLLATVAAQRAPVDDLALLGPVTSGRAAVRELRALRMLQPPIPAPDNPEGKAHEDENFGFLLTEPMRAALGKLEPLKDKAAPAKRALVIARDDVPGGEAALVEHLKGAGVDATLSTTPGYALALRGDPYTCELPDAAWNEIVSWLLAAHPNAPRLHLAASGSSSSQTASARSEAVRIGGLFGVLTEPTEPRGMRPKTAVVLLNVGANHRIGSNRMYVRWADAWAALGFRVLRLDFSGIGDSPVTAGRREKDVYSQLGMSEARRAIDFLATLGADRFVLAGICSGAFVAFYGALQDPRVSGIILMNPPTFHWKEGDSLELRTRNSFQATNFYKQRAFRADTWKRLVRGDIHVRAIGLELGKRALVTARNKVTEQAIRFGVMREPNDIARGFHELGARGCESLVVYGTHDGGVDVMEQHLGSGARKMRHDKRFHLAFLEGTDHTFTPRNAQDRLQALLSEHLLAKFG
jgi:pimeloyl-ACP methyl ester carboxylesterase